MSQNIFDNNIFFERYREIRKQEFNYNELVEQPAIKSLLPDIKGKSILDLGCGYGKNCIEFVENGAAKVIGIDISSKMIEVAKKESSNNCIEYRVMDIDQIGCLAQKFDLVFSSLVFHYINNFSKLINDIRDLLNDGGLLLFSQEHPYTTAPKPGPCWTKDEHGNKIHYNLSDYMYCGVRYTKWFIDNIEKYHRPISEIINPVISKGFVINEVLEPVPSEYALEKRPDLIDEYHKTTCIIIKATKV